VRLRLAVAVLSIAFAACDSTAAQNAAATTKAPSPAPVRALPNCNEPTTAVFAVRVNAANGGVSGDSIFCVAASGIRDFNTRLLEWPVQSRQLLTADSRSIVQVDGGNVDGSNVVGIFNPRSGDGRALGTLSSLGIGDPGPLEAVLSPDGTQLALGGAHKVLLIDMASGAKRTLATVPTDRWLMPLRWTTAGIIATKVGFDGIADLDLLSIDPTTGTISVLSPGPHNQLVISPTGKFFASTTHLDLGDGPTLRYPWQNAIDLTDADGQTRRIVSEKNHWFTPLDVSDGGQVLFSSDSQTDPVAPDMGLYLAQADGHLNLELPSAFSGQWVVARFLNGSNALVAHLVGGAGTVQSGLGVQVVQMCTDADAACQVQWSGDVVYNGRWPTLMTSIVMLPAAA